MSTQKFMEFIFFIEDLTLFHGYFIELFSWSFFLFEIKSNTVVCEGIVVLFFYWSGFLKEWS